MKLQRQRGRSRLIALVSLAGWMLAGCGGGIYLGWDHSADAPPSVALVASPTAALPGSAVQLRADASDDYRVVRVSFYRVSDNGTALWLGDDYAWPYRWDSVLPDSAYSSVRYFARAEDDAGQTRDSALFGVTVLR